jgi:FMN reductase
VPRPITIVALGGSLSPQSTTLAAARTALAGAAAAGARVALLDIQALALPMYDPALTPPPSVRHLVETVAAADGLIWASPLYHGTLSGAFKNALDWLELLSESEPAYLTDKVVALLATAGGTQGLQAINTMEYVVRALRGWTLPLTMPLGRAWDLFDDDGHPKDPAVAERLHAFGAELTRAAARMRTLSADAPASA